MSSRVPDRLRWQSSPTTRPAGNHCGRARQADRLTRFPRQKSGCSMRVYPGIGSAYDYDSYQDSRARSASRARCGYNRGEFTNHEISCRTWPAEGLKAGRMPGSKNCARVWRGGQDGAQPYRHRRSAPGAGSGKERPDAAHGVCAQRQRRAAGAPCGGRCGSVDRDRRGLLERHHDRASAGNRGPGGGASIHRASDVPTASPWW